jgi:hypothetical protein
MHEHVGEPTYLRVSFSLSKARLDTLSLFLPEDYFMNDAAFVVTAVNDVAPAHFQVSALNSDNTLFARGVERSRVVHRV